MQRYCFLCVPNVYTLKKIRKLTRIRKNSKSYNKSTSSSRLWKCWDSHIVSNVDSNKSTNALVKTMPTSPTRYYGCNVRLVREVE